MAFVRPLMSARSDKACTTRDYCCKTRRETLYIIAGTVAATLLPRGVVAEEKPQLPPGALQFTRLLSAQKQWNSLDTVLNGDGELQDADWGNLRGYLRQVYAVSADMEFMAKPWTGELRQNADDTIRAFRKLVKAMDKPAIDKDRKQFADMHAQVSAYFDSFFRSLKESSSGDVPDEL